MSYWGRLKHNSESRPPSPTPLFSFRVGNCKHLAKRSEIINGRGFAAPPKLNIETYHQNSVPRNQVKQQYHSDYTDRYYQPNDHQDSYYQDYYQTESDYGYEPENSYHSYIPQSDYDRLKQKLSTNDQLRSYIKKLKQKLNEYKNINPRQEHRIQMNNHERATSIDLSRYQRVPNQRYINPLILLHVNTYLQDKLFIPKHKSRVGHRLLAEK